MDRYRVQTAAPGWRFESESPASNDAFTARRRSNRSVEFTRPFSQANFDGGFCTNLCANPSRSGNVTRRRHFGPTFFTRYDSEHPPSHPAAPPQPSGRLRAPFHLPGHQKSELRINPPIDFQRNWWTGHGERPGQQVREFSRMLTLQTLHAPHRAMSFRTLRF